MPKFFVFFSESFQGGMVSPSTLEKILQELSTPEGVEAVVKEAKLRVQYELDMLKNLD
jgi:hypothetical protein